MKDMMKKFFTILLSLFTVFGTCGFTAVLAENESYIVINEIEADGDPDWVELYNAGSETIDLSGWYILDDDPEGHLSETTPLAQGTTIEPEEYIVLKGDADFSFGLGKKGDTVTLFNAAGEQVDSYTWTSKSSGTWGRNPDGTGEFTELTASQGTSNTTTSVVTVAINEIESNGDTCDWVEIYNYGTEDMDISGWYVVDDKGQERLTEGSAVQLPQGTVLTAGSYLVLKGEDGTENVVFTFGLGKEDTVTLCDSEGSTVDSYSWSAHAAGTYSRNPDGTGEFTDQESTKGLTNIISEPEPSEGKLVINEINSQPDDWIEIMNIGETTVDLTDYELRDSDDDHRWRFPSGTTLAAGEMIVVDENTLGLVYDDVTDTFSEGTYDIGLGGGDSVRLYDNTETLIDSYTWSEHASYNGDNALASYGRYPDGTGSFVLMPETKGTANSWYAPEVVINEVESNGDDTDWVEIYNNGTTTVDISGWYILDNDPVGHAAETTPLPEGTSLSPGEYFVFDQNTNFTFGLGKEDSVTLYNKDGVVIASYSWNGHAEGTYSRVPDGTGEFVDQAATKGSTNAETNPVVINEVQSKDPDGGDDWIELANPTDSDLDISGIVIKDSEDDHAYAIPEGTVINANGYYVIYESEFGFGLGKGDSVRLYENGILIDSTTWTDHTDPTWGLYPDVNGSEYRSTLTATPGEANVFDIPDTIAWPGSDEVTVWDTASTFLEDSSGLDFYNGQLYAVDNGTATVWVLDVAKDGTLTLADGFESGKRIHYIKDGDNYSAAGPDAEGITAAGDGYVYIASERDNSSKGVNYDVILQADLSAEGTDITASKEWDITASLPSVSANMGIEAIEWVSNDDIEGKLIDKNTGSAYSSVNYPDAAADGIFFVALEDNGHVYAFVLNNDGSHVLIADIDSQLGGAMALDYDTYEDKLWVVADNGYGNKASQIVFNGTDTPKFDN